MICGKNSENSGYRRPFGRSMNKVIGIWASGGTGDVPVCSAKWWEGRREIANPIMMALPTAINPMATTAAITMISNWIAR
jgi:hypothetical protein